MTRGVRVRAVAIFIPELSQQSSPQEPDAAYFFSYKYANRDRSREPDAVHLVFQVFLVLLQHADTVMTW